MGGTYNTTLLGLIKVPFWHVKSSSGSGVLFSKGPEQTNAKPSVVVKNTQSEGHARDLFVSRLYHQGQNAFQV